MEEGIESTNIHLRWLDNLFDSFIKIQEMEVLALEGCESLMQYLQIPNEMRLTLLPEIQYKNLRFIVRELKLLLDNLSPILKGDDDGDDAKEFAEQLKPLIENLDNRELFLKDLKKDNYIIQIEVLPFLNKSITYALDIKSKLIMNKQVAKILYVSEENKKKW